jgi:hypothetical protein
LDYSTNATFLSYLFSCIDFLIKHIHFEKLEILSKNLLIENIKKNTIFINRYFTNFIQHELDNFNKWTIKLTNQRNGQLIDHSYLLVHSEN